MATSLIRFIGDVHGKYRRYKKIIAGCDRSIQVGDMGLGFRRTQGPRVGEFLQNPPYRHMVENNAKFIRGNHDNPVECKKNTQWIPDGHIEDNMMFIGGAASNDRQFRLKDYNWWEDEQVSLRHFTQYLLDYQRVKPEIMITHDAPLDIATILAARVGGLHIPSQTQLELQKFLSCHSPKLWVFGHWHISFDFQSKLMYGTRFICLAELEFIDIDTNNI